MLTGVQYKASLADGRTTYFEGGRIEDLPGHPILGSAVENVAAGYDWLIDQSTDGVTSPLMGIPTSVEELRAKNELVHHAGMMAHVTYTSIMTLATAAGKMADSAPEGVERMQAFIADATARDIRITQCITDAKGDRSLPPGKQHRAFLDPHVRCRKTLRTRKARLPPHQRPHLLGGRGICVRSAVAASRHYCRRSHWRWRASGCLPACPLTAAPSPRRR